MRQNNFLKAGFFLVLAMLLIFMASCATMNFNQRSYQILESSQATFNLVKESVSELQKQGIVSVKDYNKIQKLTVIYSEAHNGAIAAIKSYKQGLLSTNDANAQILAVSSALSELLKVAQPYILKLDKGGK